MYSHSALFCFLNLAGFLGFVFLSEYSCFTMLCYFLLYCKLHQPYIYMYPLFFEFPSHLSHHRALSSTCCTYSRFSLVVDFIHNVNSVPMSILISQFTGVLFLNSPVLLSGVQSALHTHPPCGSPTLNRLQVAPLPLHVLCTSSLVTPDGPGWKFLGDLGVALQDRSYILVRIFYPVHTL